MKRTTLIALALITMALPAAGQEPETASPAEAASQTAPPTVNRQIRDEMNAMDLRSELYSVMRQYPSSLREVLVRDPLLMTDQTYLQTYPALDEFLDRYPEVARSPEYYLGSPSNRVDDVMESLSIVFAISIFVFGGGWLLRTVIDYFRWNRLTRIQTEVHSKLLDRFSANQDLLAYIETPAGRRFLESTPVQLDSGQAPYSAPVSRIMFSLQTGLVMLLGGLAMNFAVTRIVEDEVADVFYVLGVLAVGLGAGFVLSAVISFALSQRLGLLKVTHQKQHDDA